MTKKILIFISMLSVVGFLMPTAEAAHYGYGYGPRPQRPRYGFRHRIHGYIGGQLTGIGVLSEKTDYETGGYLGQGGGGGGIFGGVRFGPFFSLELNWNITYHNVMEDWGDYYGEYWSAFHLQTVELNGKLHIPTRGPVEPFVQAGIGGAFLGVSWEDHYYNQYSESGDYIFASGPTYNIGGGLDIWLSPFVSFGGRLLYKGMRFGEPTKYKGGKDYYTNFAHAINLDVNVILHF